MFVATFRLGDVTVHNNCCSRVDPSFNVADQSRFRSIKCHNEALPGVHFTPSKYPLPFDNMSSVILSFTYIGLVDLKFNFSCVSKFLSVLKEDHLAHFYAKHVPMHSFV